MHGRSCTASWKRTFDAVGSAINSSATFAADQPLLSNSRR